MAPAAVSASVAAAIAGLLLLGQAVLIRIRASALPGVLAKAARILAWSRVASGVSWLGLAAAAATVAFDQGRTVFLPVAVCALAFAALGFVLLFVGPARMYRNDPQVRALVKLRR
jgi:hypothetical protein